MTRLPLNALAVVVALSSAVAAGWSIALMHHSASRAPDERAGYLGLLRHLSVQWRWWLGIIASLTGLALHALALNLGSLAVVQPLVVTGLVFAFIFRALLDHRRPSSQVVRWVVLTAVGLAVFLIGARSTSSSAEPAMAAAGVFVAIGLAVALAAFAGSRQVPAMRGGLLLGLTGGVLFGLVAGVLKIATGVGGPVELLASWSLYAVVLIGGAGFLVNQHAYAVAPLTTVLPVINVINPLVALAFGVIVFAERPSGQPLTVVTELVGLVAVLAGVALLARIDDRATEPALPG